MVISFDEALKMAGYSEPRAKQRDVFDAFRAGKHVILNAPTGWGKTFAVVAALGEGHAIYSLPLRVLVDSLNNDIAKIGIRNCIAHHGANKQNSYLDQGHDPSQPVNLVFTTLDQSLSALLGIPIGVSQRQGNIVPAVIEASHLIFDEFHLFDETRSWVTALFGLQKSKNNGIILTATLSDVMISFLRETLEQSYVGQMYGVEVIHADRPFVNTKYLIEGNGLNNPDTIQIGNRTIIIRNQIDWAKTTYQELREKYNGTDTQVFLLHSELLLEERKNIECQIHESFRKGGGDKSILIATQVVEAGIDITCDVLHTDICPPSSFIQRAGRCARYEGETGNIIWHKTATFSPYQSASNEIEALGAYLQSIAVLSPEQEYKIINLNEEKDKKTIKHFKKRNCEEINEVRATKDYSKYKDRVRSINSINTAIGTDINENYKFIPIASSAFHGNGKYASFPIKFIKWDSQLKEKVETTLSEAHFALFSPEHMGYQSNYGFNPDINDGESIFIDKSPAITWDSHYELEDYALHLKRLHSQKKSVQWMINAIASHPLVGNIDAADFLTDLMIWSHDLGKLNLKWQKAHGVPSNAPFPIAHSGKTEKYNYIRVKKPPYHSWMSAFSIQKYLQRSFISSNGSGLFKAVFWAIADHHGYVDTSNVDKFESFEFGFLDYLDQISAMPPWNSRGWNCSILETKLKLTDTESCFQFFNTKQLFKNDPLDLYYMLSYVLRRCDQLATALCSVSVLKEPTIIQQPKNIIL